MLKEMDAAMHLKHLYCEELLLNEICCVQKQYHAPRWKHERPRCTVLIEALVKINVFIGYISD